MNVVIYTPDGYSRQAFPLTKESEMSCSLMGDCFIKVVFRHSDLISFEAGSYIIEQKRKWSLVKKVIPESIVGVDGYKYELKFYAVQHQLQRCRIFLTQGDIKEVTFNLTTRLSEFAGLICDNANAFSQSTNTVNELYTQWSVGDIPEGLVNKNVYVGFDGETCWDALNNIAKAFGVEWWVEDSYTNKTATIHFGKCEIGEYVDFAEGGVVSKMPISKRGDDSKYGTRFYVFGGTRNIPEDYYPAENGGVTSHVSEKRLHLPNGQAYIDSKDALEKNAIVEQVLKLDDVYPTKVDTINNVITREEEEDGVTTTYYKIFCGNTTFKPSDRIAGVNLSAKFLSGSLVGREYDLIYDSDILNSKTFEIIARKEGGAESDVVTPNKYLRPMIGDTFVLLGVKLPSESIQRAEEKLLMEAQALVNEYSSDTEVYECPVNPVYCTRNDLDFEIGQRVRLVGPAFEGNGRPSRIQGYTKKLWNKYEATYNVGDNAIYSKFAVVGKIAEDIKVASQKEALQMSNTHGRVDAQIKILQAGPDTTVLRSQLNTLIGEDYDMSAREIAEDVVSASGGGGGGGGTTPIVKITSTNETYIDVESESQNNFAIIPKVCAIDDAGGASGREDGLASAFDVQMHLEPIVDRVANGSKPILTKNVQIAEGLILDMSGDVLYALPSASEEFKDNADAILATTADINTITPYIVDFTYEDLKDAIDEGIDVPCDMIKLQWALRNNKTILIKRGLEEDSYHGMFVMNAYYEDLLYFSIMSDMGEVLVCDGTPLSYDYILSSSLLFKESGGGTTSESDVYITDFTLSDLRDTENDTPIDYDALKEAYDNKKIVVVHDYHLAYYVVSSITFIASVDRTPARLSFKINSGTMVFSAMAYGGSTNAIKASSKSVKTLVTDDTIGDINTLLETIIAG